MHTLHTQTRTRTITLTQACGRQNSSREIAFDFMCICMYLVHYIHGRSRAQQNRDGAVLTPGGREVQWRLLILW